MNILFSLYLFHFMEIIYVLVYHKNVWIISCLLFFQCFYIKRNHEKSKAFNIFVRSEEQTTFYLKAIRIRRMKRHLMVRAAVHGSVQCTINWNVAPELLHDALDSPNISNHQHTYTITQTPIPFIMFIFNSKYNQN